MSDSILYVVIASTGEYSDRSERLVRAFRTEADAQDHVVKASQRAQELWEPASRAWSEYYDKLGALHPNLSNYTSSTQALRRVIHPGSAEEQQQQQLINQQLINQYQAACLQVPTPTPQVNEFDPEEDSWEDCPTYYYTSVPLAD